MNRRQALLLTLGIAIATLLIDRQFGLGIANTLSDFLIIFLVLGLGLSIFGVKSN